MPKIILTVPHCIPMDILNLWSNGQRIERTNDTNALTMAESLSNKFNDNKVATTIIKSEQNRYILDDNRYIGIKNYTIKKDSYLWNKLRQTIKNILLYDKNKINYANITSRNICNVNYDDIIIIDCHSFPTNSDFGKNKVVVILDYKPYQDITKKINYDLNNNNISCEILEGLIGKNSILDILTLHPMYIPTILLEVNEDLDKNTLNIISNYIVLSIIDYFSNFKK